MSYFPIELLYNEHRSGILYQIEYLLFHLNIGSRYINVHKFNWCVLLYFFSGSQIKKSRRLCVHILPWKTVLENYANGLFITWYILNVQCDDFISRRHRNKVRQL